MVNLRFLGVIENMFSHDNIDYHEHIFAYEGDFEDESLYQQEEIAGREDFGEAIPGKKEGGLDFVCHWIDIDYLKSGKVLFFPTQMLEWL